MTEKPIDWIEDYFSPYEIHKHAYRGIIYHTRSKIQEITIVDTYTFGRCLVLDRGIQSAEADEYIYHEAIVHPSMILHPNPEHILILGGGEGATLREVFKYPMVKNAVMVDIDTDMITCAKTYLPSFHAGAFDDPRAEIVINDGRKYLEHTNKRFDVIIIDINDPLEGSPSSLLFTVEFYRIAAEKLKENGILVVQSGAASTVENTIFTSICNTLRKVFPHVFPYVTFIPSYATQWGFTLSTYRPGNLDITANEIDNRILSRVKGMLKFYDSITHHAIFNLPKYLREEIQKQTRVISDNNPVIEPYPGISVTDL